MKRFSFNVHARGPLAKPRRLFPLPERFYLQRTGLCPSCIMGRNGSDGGHAVIAVKKRNVACALDGCLTTHPSAFSYAFPVVAAVVILACPCNVEYLEYQMPAIAAVPASQVLFALGALIGFSFPGVAFRWMRTRWVRFAAWAVLGLCAVVCLYSWVVAFHCEDVVAAKGYYGSSEFVNDRGVISLLRSLLSPFAGWAAAMLLFLSFCERYTSDSETVRPARYASARTIALAVVFQALLCTGALAMLSARAFAFLEAVPDPFAVALLTAICCGAGFVAVRWLAGALDAQMPQGARLRPGCLAWGALGYVVWGALARVVSLEKLGSPFALAFFAAMLLVLLVMLAVLYRAICQCPANKVPHRSSGSSSPGVAELFFAAGLAPREREIAELAVSGLSSREVAEKLGIKPATVRSALQRSYKKLGVESLAGMLDYVASRQTALHAAPAPAAPGVFAGPIARLLRKGNLHPVASAAAAATCLGSVLALTVVWSSAPGVWGSARLELYSLALILVLVGFCAGGVSRTVRAFSGGRDGAVCAAAVAASLVLGFAWEELQRDAGSYPLMELSLPFELGLVLCVGVLLYRMRPDAKKMLACAILCAAGAIVAGHLAIWVMAFAAVACLIAVALRLGMVGKDVFWYCLAAVGMSAIASDVLVNKYGDYRWGSEALTAPFGGRGAFSVLCGTFAVLLCCLALAVVVLACRDMLFKTLENRAHRSGSAYYQRLRYCLLGRGLSEMQADVLLLVAQGKTSAEICEDLHYARGTVNGARGAGYRMLGIHSKMQLIQVLSQFTDV